LRAALRGSGPALLAALLAALPFVKPLALGESLYFRDASRTFFPIKQFVAEGLRAGELRFWNPHLNEGAPLHLSPLAYPLDLLHALRPDPAFFTLLLALHLPLAAALFVLLARRLGCGGAASVGGALVFALGGFALSTLNLYVYTQALAWAPLLILGLLEAGTRRGVVFGGLGAFAAASTGGVEVVAQALVIGAVLALGRDRRAFGRGLLSAVLGLALAAPGLLVMRAQLAGSARGGGFPVEVVLSQSIDPWSLPQIVVGNWHGDLADLANRWWGSNFFPNGFPYVLSLYLGGVALCLAVLGARSGSTGARRLVALALVGLVVSLGRFAGLGSLLAELPLSLPVRFPVKAFFSVHTCVALLAALGLQRLATGRAWGALCAATLATGGALVATTALPTLVPGATAWFLRGFLPPGYAWGERLATGDAILADALAAGWVVLAAAGVSLAVRRGMVPATRAVALLCALLAGDLLRTGAGLNPTVTAGFFELSPGMARVAEDLRVSGQRAFSCDFESTPAYFRARAAVPRHDAWSFALAVETLTPNLNVGLGVPTALSRDLTMMVPEDRVLAPERLGPASVAGLVPRLREAGVSRVLCLEPVAGEGLRPIETLEPARIAPLAVHVYAVDGTRPLLELVGAPGRVVGLAAGSDRRLLEVEAVGPARLVVREAMAPGWSARLDGRPVPIEIHEGRYRSVAVPAGRTRVEMRYLPPGLRPGVLIALGALTGVLALAQRAGRATRRD
jgi:hypothetical protein